MGMKHEAKKDTAVETNYRPKRLRHVETNTNRPRRKVQRHSPDRLLRRPLVLAGEITVSAEKHKGRLVVRVETPDDVAIG